MDEKNVDCTDFALMVNSTSKVETTQFDKNFIKEALINEIECGSEMADVISTQVETRLRAMKLKEVTTSFIRSLVNVILAENGYTKELKLNNDICISKFDITQVIENANKENGNTTHCPESINLNLAERLLKEYALSEVYDSEVGAAHLAGEIHIHDLGMVDRFYAFDGKLNTIDIKYKDTGEIQTLTFEELYNLLDEEEVLDDKAKVKKDNNILIRDKGRYWTDFISLTQIEEDKDIYEVELENGDKVYVTEEHPCLVSIEENSNKVIEVRTDELKIGDRFLVKATRPTKGKTWKEIYGEDETKKRKEYIKENNPSYSLTQKQLEKRKEQAKINFNSVNNKGENNNFYGHTHTEKSKEKMSESHKKLWQNSEYIAKVLDKIYEKNKSLYEDVKCKYCKKIFKALKSQKKQFCNRQCSGYYNLENGIFNKEKPNSWEELIINLGIEDFKYVGNHSFWLNLYDKNKNIHKKNPDFINEERNKVIEVWGKYWHSDTEKIFIKELYSLNNIDVLFIDDELIKLPKKNLMELIRGFANDN